MKIALIFPPASTSVSEEPWLVAPAAGTFPHLALISLGTYLKEKDPSIDLKIIDGETMNLDQIYAQLQAFRPDIVGLSPLFSSYYNSLRIALVAKDLGSQVLMGGHHVTALAKEIILNRGLYSRDYCVDAVVVEDGEEAFWQIVSQVPFSQIPNLVFQGQDRIVSNEITQLDIGNLPIPDFSLVDLDRYRGDQSRLRLLAIYSRRGCLSRMKNGACLFCSLMYKGIRCKSPSRFLEEIDEVVKKYNPLGLYDISDSFLNAQKWLEEFRGLYKDYPQKPILEIFARPDEIKPELVDAFADINLKRIVLGLESDDDEILKRLNKNYASSANREAINILAEEGIWARLNFVLGGLSENKQSLKKTLELAEWIQKKSPGFRFQPFIFTPMPGSAAFALLLGKTGSKYKNRDILDSRSLVEDWYKLFCRVDLNEAIGILKEIFALNKSHDLSGVDL